MPYRKVPLVKGEIYHVFNRAVAREPIFETKRNLDRALYTLQFYSYDNLTLRFSHYNRLTSNEKIKFWEKQRLNEEKRTEIFAFCLMSSHFHFLLRETKENGISSFLRNFQNSFAKYYNTKYERYGALFQLMFKAKRIETDEQFIHVARYIHLNPLTSFIIRKPIELENYWWCSFPDYVGKRQYKVVDTNFLLKFFQSISEFKKFTFNQIDYQRKLSKIKHLIFE